MKLKLLTLGLISIFSTLYASYGIAAQSQDNATASTAIFQASPQKVIKLAPPKPAKPQPSVPMHVVTPYISNITIVDPEELKQSPVIIKQNHEALISIVGDEVLASFTPNAVSKDYWIVKTGKTYIDPANKSILGYEAIILAEARLTHAVPSPIFKLTKIYQEVKKGDYLVPKPSQPKTKRLLIYRPKQIIDGLIIESNNTGSIAAGNSVVFINKGEQDGLLPGALLAVEEKEFSHKAIGELLVLKTFPHLSVALVRKATRPIHILDKVTNLP